MIINPKEVKKEELKGFHKPTYDEQRFLENKNKTSRTFTVRILWDALLPIISYGQPLLWRCWPFTSGIMVICALLLYVVSLPLFLQPGFYLIFS